MADTDVRRFNTRPDIALKRILLCLGRVYYHLVAERKKCVCVCVCVCVYALYICSGRVYYDLVAERKKRNVC